MRDLIILARKIAALPFDFDDPRAGVGEPRSAKRRRDRLFERDDQNAVERAGHQ